MMLPAALQELIHVPMEHGARIDLSEGLPVFRAPHEVQARIEALLLAQQEGSLTEDERRELDRYERLDDFLSLVNRLVRNALAGAPAAVPMSRERALRIREADLALERHPPDSDRRTEP